MTTTRFANLGDLEALLLLLRSCVAHMMRQQIDQWDDTYPNGDTLARDASSDTTLVVVDGKQIIGMLALNEHQDVEYDEVPWKFDQGRIAVVHRLMVDPNAQALGLGRNLMQSAEKLAETLGYSAIRLDAFANNPRALRLYLGLGYRRAGQVQFRKGPFDCFEKQLAAPTKPDR